MAVSGPSFQWFCGQSDICFTPKANLRLASANDLAAQWSGLMISMHDSAEMSEIWLKGTRDFESLDPVSKLRFSAFFGRFLRNSEALYFRVLDKTLDPTIWRGIERTIRDLLCLPGSQAWWETRKHWYTDVFQSWFQTLLPEETRKLCLKSTMLRSCKTERSNAL